MLTIRKFKNVYGIKDLKNPELIKGNTIIYAPNGVMKSSFSHGINTIKNGVEVPKDVVNNIESEFEILFEDKVITNSTSDRKFRAVVFSEGLNDKNIFEDPKIADLAISQGLRTKYNECLKRNNQNTQPFEQAFYSGILGLGKRSVKSIELFNQIFGGRDSIESILNIPDSFHQVDEKILSIPYQSIFNPSVEVIVKGDEFKRKIESYISILKKEFDEKYFSNGFTLNGLISLFELAKETGFFSAGHKLFIDDKALSEMEVGGLIDSTIQSVFKEKDVKTAFENTAKLFKKKETKELEEQLAVGDSLIEYLVNYDQFKIDYLTTYFSSNIPNYNELKTGLQETEKEIEAILTEAESEQNTWIKVLNIYNLRFRNTIEKIEIVNDKDAKIGRKAPVFSIRHSESNSAITPEIEKRFSAGEKRTILILNILFEIAIMNNDDQKFLVIFDDIIESFDYKNKFAILEYLKEFASNDKIQLIILTHNFDFYRNCRNTLDDGLLDAKLMAYSSNRVVSLYNNDQEYYEDLSFFKTWKNNNQIKYVLSLIPFLRNIVQLRDDKEHFTSLCRFVHYNDETDKLRLSDIEKILSEYKIKLPDGYDAKSYLEYLQETANVVMSKSSLNESMLEEKIILGLYIRVYLEKFLWQKHLLIFEKEPEITNKYAKTNELYKILKPSLTQSEIEVTEVCLVTSPSFVHINSFMYEPLIDVGCDRLVQCAKLLKDIM